MPNIFSRARSNFLLAQINLRLCVGSGCCMAASSFLRGRGASRILVPISGREIPETRICDEPLALEKTGEPELAAEPVVHDAQQAVRSQPCSIVLQLAQRPWMWLADSPASVPVRVWLFSASATPRSQSHTNCVHCALFSHLALLLDDCLLGPSTIECYTWRVDRRSSADSAHSGTGHFTTCGVFVIQ